MSLFGGRVTLNRRRGIKLANLALLSLKLIHGECGFVERAPLSSFPPLAHMVVIFEPLSVVFVSSSHLSLSCFGSSGGHRTATRAEKSFFRPCIFGSSLRFLVGKASLRQLTEKRRTQSEPKFRRRRRGTRHPSRRRGARGARGSGPPPGSVGPPARYGPPSPLRIFPVLPLPSFSCLHQNFPRRRWSVRPSVAVRSFFPSRLALRPPPPRPRLLSTCERELAPWPPPRSPVTPSTVPR